ncbi:MAG: PKD domain-containing protein, partial [Pirellula sp.]
GTLVEVTYYKSTAYNDDEFESTDSILIDLVLPTTGDYWLKVDSFTRNPLTTDPALDLLEEVDREMYLDKINDTDIGKYELLVYRFARANDSDTTNVLQGRGGFDVIEGTPVEDYNIYLGTLPTNASSTEVAPLVVTIPFTDPAGGGWTATVTYGDGTSETLTNFTLATGILISHTYPDQGTYTLRIDLTNDDGKSTSGSFSVTISAAAPTATLASTGNLEGGETTLTVTGIDSAYDLSSLRYIITPNQSLRNSATYANSSAINTYTESFNDNTSKTLYIRVMDRDGLSNDYQTTLVIANVPPTGLIENNGPVNEGSYATISITGASDVSSTDTTAGLRYAFGTSPASLPTTFAAALTSSSANITFGDNGTYTVYGRVFDKDNGYTEYSTTVVVNNVAPTVSVGSITNPAIQNSPVTITANGFDPAGDNDLLTYAFTVVRVSDGSTVSSAEGASATHTWTPDTTGTYRVTIVATDEDGGVSSTAVQEFEVLSPLTLVVGLPSDGFKGVPGQTRTYSLTANSPGSSGTFTYVIDWKDGTAVQTVNGPASTTVDHIYPLAGTYAPTISVTNSLGRTVSQTLSAIAINAWEVQGSAIAIGASDGGSDDDTLTLDALTTAGQFAFSINGAAAMNVTTTGTIRPFGGAGTDRLVFRGNSFNESMQISGTSLVYNVAYTIEWDSMEAREIQAGVGNDAIDVVDGAIVTI